MHALILRRNSWDGFGSRGRSVGIAFVWTKETGPSTPSTILRNTYALIANTQMSASISGFAASHEVAHVYTDRQRLVSEDAVSLDDGEPKYTLNT